MYKVLKLFGKDVEKYKKVSYFNLQGQISSSMTYKVYKALKKFKPENSKAIALIINSSGGSLAQAHIIQKKFELVKEKYNLPLYTFAEDYALSSAFYLLSIGDQIYCNRTSLVGGVGTQIQVLKFRELFEHYKLEVRSFHQNNTSTFLRQVDPLGSTEASNLLETINNSQYQELCSQIQGFIANRIADKDQILQGQIYSGQELFEKLKFSNGVADYFTIMEKDFPQNKLENATQKTQREKMMDFLQNQMS